MLRNDKSGFRPPELPRPHPAVDFWDGNIPASLKLGDDADISAHATISGMETQGCGQVRARAKTAKMGPSIRRIALETGVGTMTIQRILAASCRDTDRSL